MILAALILLAEIGNQIPADFDDGASKRIRLSRVRKDRHSPTEISTSLSSCLTRSVICLITSRGASSESLMIKADTDFGPRVSLLLNSLLLSSLDSVSISLNHVAWAAYLRISSASCG